MIAILVTQTTAVLLANQTQKWTIRKPVRKKEAFFLSGSLDRDCRYYSCDWAL